MTTAETGARITFKNVQFLTDFSEPSEAALPFAVAIAREFGATIHALHVLILEPLLYATADVTATAISAVEESARAGMQRVESQLAGVPHKTTVIRGAAVWPSLEAVMGDSNIDLIILGTHGRTGVQKVLLGSVAEEIFRRAPVPVMTIGPRVRNAAHNGARFSRILFATDFTPESLAATPYAISLAEENEAQLILIYVIKREQNVANRPEEKSIANAMHDLLELVPKDAELWCRPEAVVDYGDPADRILQTAAERHADLVVLGVRDAGRHMGTATHIGNAIAHKIVARASCPVLTARGHVSTSQFGSPNHHLL